MRNRWSPAFFGTICLAARLLAPGRAGAQATAHPTEIHWYHAVGGIGVLAALSPLDLPIRNSLQAHRTPGKDRVARVVRRMGQPEVYATVGLGTLGTGLVFGNDDVKRAGGRIVAALAVAGVGNQLLKVVVGRRRPL